MSLIDNLQTIEYGNANLSTGYVVDASDVVNALDNIDNRLSDITMQYDEACTNVQYMWQLAQQIIARFGGTAS